MTESFYALVGKMEQDSSARVFEMREMRPLSPNGVDVDWSIVAAKEVERMLSWSRVVERRNLKKNIEMTVHPLLATIRVPLRKIKVPKYEDDKDDKKKKEEVSNILVGMGMSYTYS
jgi:hypothetical protein